MVAESVWICRLIFSTSVVMMVINLPPEYFEFTLDFKFPECSWIRHNSVDRIASLIFAIFCQYHSHNIITTWVARNSKPAWVKPTFNGEPSWKYEISLSNRNVITHRSNTSVSTLMAIVPIKSPRNTFHRIDLTEGNPVPDTFFHRDESSLCLFLFIFPFFLKFVDART